MINNRNVIVVTRKAKSDLNACTRCKIVNEFAYRNFVERAIQGFRVNK